MKDNELDTLKAIITAKTLTEVEDAKNIAQQAYELAIVNKFIQRETLIYLSSGKEPKNINRHLVSKFERALCWIEKENPSKDKKYYEDTRKLLASILAEIKDTIIETDR